MLLESDVPRMLPMPRVCEGTRVSPLELAIAEVIRGYLDELRYLYGPKEWDADGIEKDIRQLVFDE